MSNRAHLQRDLWSVLQGCREDLRRMAEAHPPGDRSGFYGRALALLEMRLADAIEAVEMELNDPAGSG